MSDELLWIKEWIKKAYSWIENVVSWIEKNIFILLSCGIFILFVLFILVMSFFRVASILMSSTGIADKPELLELIGWGIGGFIATLGAVGLMKRTIALDEQNKIAEKGHIHERFKAASEHLSNVESVSGRIASFHEFYRLAEITAKMPEEKGLKETIFDFLCAHLRQTTKEKDYKSNLKPTEEVKSLLDILFQSKNKNISIFSGLNANLVEVHLQGADLRWADLGYANLQEANLQEADLGYANLESANLQYADLQYADLESANLQEADLQEADLPFTNLKGANLEDAKIQGADLEDANLQYANLKKADMEDANLEAANLQYANLEDADLQGANLQGAQRHKSIEMPDGWKDIVEKDNDGKTGLVIMNDEGEVIERL